MNGYVTKPFQETELYNAISRYLPIKQTDTDIPSSENKAHDRPSALNLREMEDAHGGDKAYVKELAEIFLSQIRLELQALDESYAAQDLQRMGRTAHSMKSTVGYVGLFGHLEGALTRVEICSDSAAFQNGLHEDFELIKLVCYNAIAQLEADLPHYAG
jgi:hypothetical protein